MQIDCGRTRKPKDAFNTKELQSGSADNPRSDYKACTKIDRTYILGFKVWLDVKLTNRFPLTKVRIDVGLIETQLRLGLEVCLTIYIIKSNYSNIYAYRNERKVNFASE